MIEEEAIIQNDTTEIITSIMSLLILKKQEKMQKMQQAMIEAVSKANETSEKLALVETYKQDHNCKKIYHHRLIFVDPSAFYFFSNDKLQTGRKIWHSNAPAGFPNDATRFEIGSCSIPHRMHLEGSQD